MHRMPQPTWGRAGTHTPEERVYWLNTIILMTSQCVLKKTDLLVTKIKTRPYKIISPIFWILSISAKSRKIYWSWQIVSFWGYSLTLFSVGVSKFYSHFFFGHHVDVYDFMCFSSPGKGRRSLRNSCRQRGRWRAHEQVHWTRCTLNNLVILDQIDFSSSLCEKSCLKSSTLE